MLVGAGASLLGPEQLRVFSSQLLVLGDLSWRLGQVVALRLEAGLVGRVGDLVGDAVVSDVLVAALLVQTARLRYRARQESANLLNLIRPQERV